jgi:MerR family regulatory protein
MSRVPRANLPTKPVSRQVSKPAGPSLTTTGQGGTSGDTASPPKSSLLGSHSTVDKMPGLRHQMTDREVRVLFARLSQRGKEGANSDKTPTSLRHTGGRPPTAGLEGLDRPITRGLAARMLGVDVSTVRRLEANGKLHPEIGAGGIRYFDRIELRSLKEGRIRAARDRTTEIRVAAFRLFKENVEWREVAIRLRHDPYRVHRLWRLYRLGDDKTAEDSDE